MFTLTFTEHWPVDGYYFIDFSPLDSSDIQYYG